METRRRTWFDERGLVVADRRLPFYAGAMHYWRVPPIRWGASLRAIHALGLTCVETCVPWRVHEPDSGASLWSGERDLARFLEAARAAGLSVILRPGPQISAELAGFGIPDWVLAEPDCQARTAQGTPAWFPAPPRAFPIPSYASQKFHAHVRRWYAAVADVIRPHLAPDGPVVALGVDHAAISWFRTAAFDLDYHPDALAWWRESSGLDDAPRDASDPARAALWLKFKADYRSRALTILDGLLDEAGLSDIARFHPPLALDANVSRADLPAQRHRAAALVGNAASTNTVPLAPDVGVGFLPWLPPLDASDDPTRERDHLLTLLASGIRGFNLVMVIERDRFYGAAISATGQVEAKWIAPLLAALADADWTALRRYPPAAIALVDAQADARFGLLTNLIDPVTPVLAELLQLGPGGAAELGTDPGAILARRWQSAIVRALELAQVPFAIVDESTPADALARYRAVVAPTIDRIDRGLLERLRALADHKRAIVVLGPGTPTKDELDQPHSEPLPKRIGRLKAGSLDDSAGLGGLADDLAALAGELPEAWQVERPEDVRAYAFADATERVRVVFMVGDNARATTAILFADGVGLRDPLAKETIRIDNGRATIPMPARGVRMFIVEQLVAV